MISLLKKKKPFAWKDYIYISRENTHTSFITVFLIIVYI